MHFDGLDFSGHVSGSESDNHAGLDDTSLNTTNGHRSNTTDFVDILERKSEGLIGGSRWGFDGINGIEEGLSLGDTSLGLLGPALVPCHAIKKTRLRVIPRGKPRIYLLGGLLQHVVTVPARDGDESNGLGVVADLLDEGGGFLDNFVESVLAPLHEG